jgi:hypothetical protein
MIKLFYSVSSVLHRQRACHLDILHGLFLINPFGVDTAVVGCIRVHYYYYYYYLLFIIIFSSESQKKKCGPIFFNLA